MSAIGNLAGKLVDGVAGGGGGGSPTPESTPAPTDSLSAGPRDPGIEARSAEFASASASLGQRAAAAGATRSGNEADMLGFVTPKKRSASRTILG